MKKASLLIGLGLVSVAARAQLQVNGPLYLAPGAVLAVNGGNVAATAGITGAGTLLLNGNATQSLDMAGNSVPRLDVNNAAGVALAGNTTVDTALTFSQGNITLGSSNLVFGPNATYSGADSGKHAITNGTGVVTKQGLAQNASFTFPVAQGVRELTPISVNNQAAATRSFSVQVKTYAASGAGEGNAAYGIDRTWQVTSSAAGAANIGLTHNDADNVQGPRTSGASFNPAAAYVTQQGATAGTWSKSTTTYNGGTPVNTVGATFTVPATPDGTSYFSKTSDQFRSLTRGLLVSPLVYLQGAWNPGTGAMTTSLNTQSLIPTAQPYNVAPFNYSGSEAVTAIPAGVTDWVLVDLRSEITSTNTTSSIVATRAAFLKNNGQVVDLDGTSTLSFPGVAEGNYIIGIRHRNHLGIQSSAAQTMAYEVNVSRDLTNAANVYRNATTASNNEPLALLGGGAAKYGMWAGNTNGNGTIRVNGAAAINDYLYIVNNALSTNPANVVGPVYSNGDVNMNGVVRVTGAATINDYLFIVNNALATDPSTTLVQHQQ